MNEARPWEKAIGRRIRLRDLFVFFTVVECGSMSKAAQRLGVSTPSVSELIADLEHAVGVRLLDRSHQGVLATRYGEALLARGRAAFDELQQGVRDIESIADPGGGEVRVGCPESAAAFLAHVIEHVVKRHPRMRFVVRQAHSPAMRYAELQERRIDLALGRPGDRPASPGLADEGFDVEVLFDDPFAAVVGERSKWARRRNIDLAELSQERWILPPLDAMAGLFLSETFAARGLAPPQPNINTFSIHLRNELASRGDYIALLPRSVLRSSAARYGLKELPVRLASRPSPLAAVTLRNRSLTPAVEVFMQSARETARIFSASGEAGRPQATRKR